MSSISSISCNSGPSIAQKLIECSTPLCQNQQIADIRIGLGYTCVELADGAAGVAWTPPGSDGNAHAGSCSHLAQAGSLHEMTEPELLGWLSSDNHYQRAIALATCNALNMRTAQKYSDGEAVSLLKITPEDRVVMVGFFGPLVPKIKQIGCTFDVLDLNSSKPGIVDLRSGPGLLAACDVAIITATSIINNTIDGLLKNLQNNRAGLLLGPSTPLCRTAFSDTRITQLSGALVDDVEPLKRIISQGGGTMLMKQQLQFVSLLL